MSYLTKALDRILNWLRNNQYSWIRRTENPIYLLQPGLSRAEINSILTHANLLLPEEVYELYQWRNGGVIGEWDYINYTDLFNIDHKDSNGYSSNGYISWWGFVQFQSVVTENIQNQNDYACLEQDILNRISAFPIISDFRNPSAFQIFRSKEGCMTGYVYKDNYYKSFPVIFLDFYQGSNTVLMLYASLTDMMMTIAESYETAYYIREDGYLAKDTNKVLEIWRKYNSDKLVEGVLTKIKQLEQILPQLEMGFELLKEIADIFKFSHDERLIEPLISVLIRPPTNTVHDENLDYLRQMSSLYLGQFGGKNVAIQLIQALKNEYWMIRYWAVITLGDIKETHAIPHLNELLEDNHELVRQAAQESLYKLTNPNSQTDLLYSNPAVGNIEASAALYGMTLSDMLNPDIEATRDKLNISNTDDNENNYSDSDDNPDNIPF